MSLRQTRAEVWLKSVLGAESYTLKALPGDASFRRYFRVKTQTNSFLLMDAPPQLEPSDCFVAIAKTYYDHGVHTPYIFSADVENGFLLLEDFGDKVLNAHLTLDNVSDLYQHCYALLPKIQACQNIPGWTLPHFGEQLVEIELENFYDWCLQQFCHLTLSVQEQYLLHDTFAFLKKISNIQPQVGVHRDYHSRNLMLLPENKIGVLDFQDAVIGPITYDLVSLLRDCYINWSRTQVEAWVFDYYENFVLEKTFSYAEFQAWFDWQGIQRHLKAIFIFCRKYLRDGSTNYLCDIGRTLNYVEEVSTSYPELAAFTAFIKTRVKDVLLQKIDDVMGSGLTY